MILTGKVKRFQLPFHNIGSLRSAIAVNDVKLHCLTFFQGLEAFCVDCGKMHKDIAAILALNETVTFFCIEPFDFTLHAKYIPFLRQTYERVVS